MISIMDIEAYQLDILDTLIAIDTVNPPGNEHAAVIYLLEVFKEMPFACEVQNVSPGRSNLLAKLAGKPGPELVLCGHLDTVAADPSQWTGDPFAMRRDGGRVYGRGVSDMKGGISAMVAAAREFIDEKRELSGTLSLLFVADEECGTMGAKRYIACGGRPDAVIIGEPTNMDVCIACRGVTRYHVDVVGKSGHASRPEDAVNPLPVAGKFIQLACARNDSLKSIRHPILPPPTITPTMIVGGEQPNSIPGHCRVTIDRRTLPHENRASVLEEYEELRRGIPEAGMLGVPDVFIDVPAGQGMPGSTLGARCQAILKDMGLDATICDFPAGSDQFAFSERGIDSVLLGPGNIAQAHTANEYIEISQLSLARRFYLNLVKEYLS